MGGEDAEYSEAALLLPLRRLPLGYHRLTVEARGISASSLVISAPRVVPPPGEPGQPTRTWGVFLPLHALRSARSWGAGDFTDLDRLVEWTGRLGGRSVATLPLLATFPDHASAPSPYSPASRLFWNELFLDVTAVPEVAFSDQARALLESTRLQREVATLRASRLVDYRKIWTAKRRVLEALVRAFFATPSLRRDDFERWLKLRPEAEDYASFRAACERRGPWPQWPSPERDGRLRARTTPVEEGARRYHAYAQWLSEQQLAAVSERAQRQGVRLYFDLPLGVHPAGYDVWRERQAFALGVSAGAPPDAFFSGGQDWGLPPPHPDRIREQGYRYQVACLRNLVRYAGVLRLDHVMALHRLFWVPHGMGPRHGVYVRYRPDEQYAILSLEAARAGALVVGEDLGTVPSGVRRSLRRHGMLRSHILQFELEPNVRSAIRPPPRDAVASIGTHDTPTFASFWRGLEIEDRQRWGWIAAAEARRERAAREALRSALLGFLRRQGWLGVAEAARPSAPETEAAVLRACLAHLAAGPAQMVVVALEDLWLEPRPQNVPGTTDEYPNWRRPARFAFDSFRGRPQVAGTPREIDRLRRRPGW